MSNEASMADRLPGEEWADMPGLAGLCEVSTLGRVRTIPREGVKKDNQGRVTTANYGGRYLSVEKVTGRFYVTPRVDGKIKKIRLPEAIIEAFRGEIANGRKVAYRNGDSGDHRLENLAWVEQVRPSASHSKSGASRNLSERQIEIISTCALSDEDLAVLTGLPVAEIRQIRASPEGGAA